MPRCSARSGRRCWIAPARARPRGSRTAWRAASRIRHPRELRAIPNNAILQQLGWCANTLQGLGAAAARHPETFTEMRQNSRRFHRAMDLATHALAHSDIDVLRAVIATLDPGTWLDRAAHTTRWAGARRWSRWRARWSGWTSGRRRSRCSAACRPIIWRCASAWPDAPHMATREVLLHALRLALIHRIWLLATEISDFSPRHGVTRPVLEAAMLRLDIEPSLRLLAEIFPAAPDAGAECDYAEPAPPRGTAAYAREHAEIFAPMRALFGWCARSRPRSPTRSARSGDGLAWRPRVIARSEAPSRSCLRAGAATPMGCTGMSRGGAF